VAFALVTRLVLLPIEFGASRIALCELSKTGCYNDTELRKMKRMLRACAFTYVAAVLDVLLLIFLLVLAMLCSGRKDNPRKNK
jgi:Zn-dependent membrane protease YugP